MDLNIFQHVNQHSVFTASDKVVRLRQIKIGHRTRAWPGLRTSAPSGPQMRTPTGARNKQTSRPYNRNEINNCSCCYCTCTHTATIGGMSAWNNFLPNSHSKILCSTLVVVVARRLISIFHVRKCLNSIL